MNLDDRLRNHLHNQNDELTLTIEGIDAVQARSARRKQQRAVGGVLGIVAIALAIGGAALSLGSNSAADFATEGEDNAASSTTLPADSTEDVAAQDTVTPADLEFVLPDPGSALELSAVSNDGAPGSYSHFSNGASNGRYFVVATAPGLTLDDNGNDEFPRPDTVYAFDGSAWTSYQSSAGDRFVSGIDTSAGDIMYAVSTGTTTTTGLSVGASTNAGKDWDWTPIDLTPVFGADTANWPNYFVARAANGNQQLVIVTTDSAADFDQGVALANENGAGIGSTADVYRVDHIGIHWFAPEAEGSNGELSCQALAGRESQILFESQPLLEQPDLNWSDDRTPEEDAALQAWLAKSDALLEKQEQQVLEAVRASGRCDAYIDCSVAFSELTKNVEAEIDAFHLEIGLGATDLPDDSQQALMQPFYEEIDARTQDWIENGGCAEELNFFADDEGDLGGSDEFRSWEELGVTVPSAWQPVQHAFLVDNGTVSDLGDPFVDDGFVIEADHDGRSWTVTMDATQFNTEADQIGATPTVIQYSSADGVNWVASSADGFTLNHQLANGSSFGLDYSEDSAIVRTDANGVTTAFSLADLAPELDTDNHVIVGLETGEYGVVASAIRWNEATNSADSILLYSPDGQGWGATAVPDAEITNMVVGAEGVVVFVNNSEREPGTPPAVFLATA